MHLIVRPCANAPRLIVIPLMKSCKSEFKFGAHAAGPSHVGQAGSGLQGDPGRAGTIVLPFPRPEQKPSQFGGPSCRSAWNAPTRSFDHPCRPSLLTTCLWLPSRMMHVRQPMDGAWVRLSKTVLQPLHVDCPRIPVHSYGALQCPPCGTRGRETFGAHWMTACGCYIHSSHIHSSHIHSNHSGAESVWRMG